MKRSEGAGRTASVRSSLIEPRPSTRSLMQTTTIVEE